MFSTSRTRALPRVVACLALAVSIPCWAADSVDAAAGWEPGEKKQGPGYAYQIFSLQKEDERFLRYQLRGTIDAPAEVVQRTARRVSVDPARAPEGQKRTVLSQDDDETVLLTEVDLPAMFSDRDVVTSGRSSVDPVTGVRRIDFKAVDHPAAPVKDGVIRIQKTGGYWELVPDGDQRTKVTVENYVDLGGSLPGWLVSGMMASNVGGNFEEVAKESLQK
jgi:hypothetical protein